MYAAAGGASIANRRKQKRLQQTASNKAAPVGKLKVPATGIHHHHHHHHSSSKLAQAHVPPIRAPPAQPAPSSSSIAFHHGRRRPERSQQLAPPVSPIQFPISPPPLSLESTSPGPNKSSFPFPPPSILDLRVAPSTSELQAALLIRRDKQRLRGGKAVNFRELPSNLATRLIPPLPRYPPKSYAYGCSGSGPGKAAWQVSRHSPVPLTPISSHGESKTKQCEAHRRWMKRNRIRDASYCYGSSGEDDEELGSSYGRRRGEVSAAVNTMLYAGLGTTALGLVIFFVGTGEKGFLSSELRLIGPSLLCAGLLCCLLRVLLCLCLCKCGKSCRKGANKKKEKSSKMEAAAAGILPTASLLPLQPPPVKQRREPKVSPPTIDTRSCTAPLSLTPSPSPSPSRTSVAPASVSAVAPPTPEATVAPSGSTVAPPSTSSKGGELLLCPSQLQDGEV